MFFVGLPILSESDVVYRLNSPTVWLFSSRWLMHCLVVIVSFAPVNFCNHSMFHIDLHSSNCMLCWYHILLQIPPIRIRTRHHRDQLLVRATKNWTTKSYWCDLQLSCYSFSRIGVACSNRQQHLFLSFVLCLKVRLSFQIVVDW